MLIGTLGDRNLVVNGSVINRDNSASSTVSAATRSARRSGIKSFMGRLVEAGKSIQKLRDDFGDVRASSPRSIKAKTTGSTAVSLNTAGSKSTLTSTGEISTLTTTVDNRSPTWPKAASTSEITVHGTYTGSVDNTYQLRNGNNKVWTVGGGTSFNLNVMRNGSKIGTVTVPAGYTEGTQLTIDAGLSVSLSLGDIGKRDRSETFSGLTGVDAVIDPDAAFDGSDGAVTNLDSAVSAGSFEVNGTTINVAADDSVHAVLDAITSSAAGVTAAYDDTTDTITLTNKSVGADAITLGADTSGFLVATKLSGASTSLGTPDERTVAMDQLAAFAGVSSGSFQINGVSIALDVTTDSLSDLIDRVNSSSADVLMSYSSSGTGKLSVRSTQKDDQLVISSDTTGLLSTFGVEENTFEPKTRRGMSARIARELVAQVAEMVDVFNEMSGTVDNESLLNGDLTAARDGVRAVLKKLTDSSSDTIDTRMGLVFNVAEGASKSFIELGGSGEKELLRALSRRPNDTLSFLFGSDDEDGFVDSMISGLGKVQSAIVKKYGSVGILLDVKA